MVRVLVCVGGDGEGDGGGGDAELAAMCLGVKKLD
jgi:hypothetical protein